MGDPSLVSIVADATLLFNAAGSRAELLRALCRTCVAAGATSARALADDLVAQAGADAREALAQSDVEDAVREATAGRRDARLARDGCTLSILRLSALGRCWGVLIVSAAHESFAPTFEALAARAAVVLATHGLGEDGDQASVQRAEIARFLEVSSALLEATTRAAVSTALVDAGARAIAASGSAVVLVQADGAGEAIAVTPNLVHVLARGERVVPGARSPIARALGSRAAEWLDRRELIARRYPSWALRGVHSLAIVPLVVGGRTAALWLASFSSGVQLDGERRDAMLALARQASVALERAILDEAERLNGVRLQKLADASVLLASSLDWERTVANVGDAVVPSFARGCTLDVVSDGGALVRVLTKNAAESVDASCEASTHDLELRGHRLGVLTLHAPDSSSWSAHVIRQALLQRIALALDAARLHAQAVKSLATRDEFLAIAGHELRTPITTLRMYLYGIERFGMAAMPGALAARQLARLERLVDDLLDVSKIAAGKLSIERSEVDLAALVRDLIAGLDNPLVTSGDTPIELDVRAPVRGRWDAFRLSQVVMNLLSNAVKYGRGRPVRVVVGREAELAEIRVRDAGIGIPEDSMARIFDRFERAGAPTSYGGFGLGLWISKQIVEAHGGTIRVHSAPNEGAEFVVELPMGVT